MSDTVDFDYQLAANEVSFSLDETLYPVDAVYGAAYLFVDRCYVFLTRDAESKVGVRLRSKHDSDDSKMEGLAGEFANELLNQVLRQRIGESTAKIREFYMQRAFFSGTPATSTIDALLAELDEEELADDPLEISVPWEEDGSSA